MMKQEFEALAGYEVSLDDYNNIIEPMYMATNLDKAEFVKVIDKKRFALKSRTQLKNEMKKLAEQLEITCTHFTDYESKERLDKIREEYTSRFYGQNYSSMVEEEMTQSCFYPTKVVFFNRNSGRTVETIVF
ncbi:MAG: hypothetical protein HUJ53_01425 [Holdemanella sp.]|nr:hypothetical protein [Holdemanella sp.]